ncbi:hypothetical protein A3J22_00195 [Candidatus Beckwithbacteria bacterium RIFCSPLOWO2_02_FULL_49_12]|nr:MAG: hypothetical protein A3J22_00195 [Candidatus Beckwithbacteria bacterium RIFCSPLOWO2_02_FULL_49_12]
MIAPGKKEKVKFGAAGQIEKLEPETAQEGQVGEVAESEVAVVGFGSGDGVDFGGQTNPALGSHKKDDRQEPVSVGQADTDQGEE